MQWVESVKDMNDDNIRKIRHNHLLSLNLVENKTVYVCVPNAFLYKVYFKQFGFAVCQKRFYFKVFSLA